MFDNKILYITLLISMLVHSAIFEVLNTSNVQKDKVKQKPTVVVLISSYSEPKVNNSNVVVKEEIIKKPEILEKPKPKENKVIEKVQKAQKVRKEVKKQTIKEPIKKPIIKTATNQIKNNIDLNRETTTFNISKPTEQNSSNSINSSQIKTNENNISIYLTSVKNKISQNLQYPNMAKKMGIEGQGEFLFIVLKDGSIKEDKVQIKKSTSKSILDNSAIQTILSSTPFKSPPLEEIEVIAPISFKLN